MGSEYGSKATAEWRQAITALMPPHDTYIDSYLGGGAIVTRIPRTPRNIGVDRDGEALEQLRCNYPAELARRCVHWLKPGSTSDPAGCVGRATRSATTPIVRRSSAEPTAGRAAMTPPSSERLAVLAVLVTVGTGQLPPRPEYVANANPADAQILRRDDATPEIQGRNAAGCQTATGTPGENLRATTEAHRRRENSVILRGALGALRKDWVSNQSQRAEFVALECHFGQLSSDGKISADSPVLITALTVLQVAQAGPTGTACGASFVRRQQHADLVRR